MAERTLRSSAGAVSAHADAATRRAVHAATVAARVAAPVRSAYSPVCPAQDGRAPGTLPESDLRSAVATVTLDEGFWDAAREAGQRVIQVLAKDPVTSFKVAHAATKLFLRDMSRGLRVIGPKFGWREGDAHRFFHACARIRPTTAAHLAMPLVNTLYALGKLYGSDMWKMLAVGTQMGLLPPVPAILFPPKFLSYVTFWGPHAGISYPKSKIGKLQGKLFPAWIFRAMRDAGIKAPPEAEQKIHQALDARHRAYVAAEMDPIPVAPNVFRREHGRCPIGFEFDLKQRNCVPVNEPRKRKPSLLQRLFNRKPGVTFGLAGYGADTQTVLKKYISESAVIDPSIRYYMGVGHSVTNDTTLWTVDSKGKFHVRPSHAQKSHWFGIGAPVAKRHEDYPQMQDRKFWGRADHTTKEVSIAYESKVRPERVAFVKRQLEKEFPGHTVVDFGADDSHSSGERPMTYGESVDTVSSLEEAKHETVTIKGKEVTYFVDPTPEELKGMLRKSKTTGVNGHGVLRGVADDTHTYWWDAHTDILHHQFARAVGVPAKMKNRAMCWSDSNLDTFQLFSRKLPLPLQKLATACVAAGMFAPDDYGYAGDVEPPEWESLEEAKHETLPLDNGMSVHVTWNPTAAEVKAMTKKYGNLRGLPDRSDYVYWPAYEAVHYQVAQALGIKTMSEWYKPRIEVVPYWVLNTDPSKDDPNEEPDGRYVMYSPDYGNGLHNPRVQALKLKPVSGKDAVYDGDQAWVLASAHESIEETLTFDQAVAEFGVTTDPLKAAWVLPDGRMLDFSAAKHKSETGKTKGLKGRVFDHREIARVAGEEPTAGLEAFMRRGGVRYWHTGDYLAIQYNKPLTDAQVRVISSSRKSAKWMVCRYVDAQDLERAEGGATNQRTFLDALRGKFPDENVEESGLIH